MSGLTRHNLCLKEQRASKFPSNTLKRAVEENRVTSHFYEKKTSKPKNQQAHLGKKKKNQPQTKSIFQNQIRIKANNPLTSGFALVTDFPPLMGTCWQQR